MAYTLTGEKTGTVRFDQSGTITQESRARSAKVTSNPVEDGSQISDHVILNPEQFNISGVTVGGTEAADRLVEMWQRRDILSYTGKERISDIVITSLTIDRSAGNRDGVGFKATFQQVRFVSAQYFAMGATPLMSQQDAGKAVAGDMAKSSKSASNAGRKTPATEYISNDTYTDYVNSYSSKPAASTGPTTRDTPSYSGLGG